MNQDTRSMLARAFFLDTLKLPANGPEMTAYEVGQRVQEYIRGALPIFEPTEMEYNAAICDETFELLQRNGAFGSPGSWPKELRGADIDFTFESPLHDVIEQQKGQKFQEAQQLIASAMALDQSAQFVPNAIAALRDALQGIGVPATWMNSQAQVEQKSADAQAQAQSQQRLANIEQASNAVKNIGMSGVTPGQGAVSPTAA